MQGSQGGAQITPALLAAKGPTGKIFRKIGPQVRFILVVGEQGIGIMLVMGICKGIRQIVRQLPQRVVMPDGPTFPALQPGNPAENIRLGIGIVMAPEQLAADGAF